MADKNGCLSIAFVLLIGGAVFCHYKNKQQSPPIAEPSTPNPPSIVSRPIIWPPEPQELEPDARNIRTKSPTPYDKGYDEGYEQGYEDGREGYNHGHNYNDSNDYDDDDETKYVEGYDKGYDEGYDDGYRKWENEHKDEEAD